MGMYFTEDQLNKMISDSGDSGVQTAAQAALDALNTFKAKRDALKETDEWKAFDDAKKAKMDSYKKLMVLKPFYDKTPKPAWLPEKPQFGRRSGKQAGTWKSAKTSTEATEEAAPAQTVEKKGWLDTVKGWFGGSSEAEPMQ